MQRLLWIAQLAIFCACTAHADSLSMFFRYEVGTRVDFFSADRPPETAADNMGGSAVLHVLIPEDAERAIISLTYGKDAKGRSDQTYPGLVAHRSVDMITILVPFGDKVDKMETIVLYPQKGSGFALSHSAFLGRGEVVKAMAEASPGLPFGSVTVFPLVRFSN